LDGATKKQELFRERGFTGIRVRDDGECLSACYFFFESHGAKIGGEWRMASGEWRVKIMENGEWRMGNGEWGMENGEWRMGNGEWWRGLNLPAEKSE
jgi:hypothetical protein